MNVNTYLLIAILIFSITLYPLGRKLISLLEILVNKYIQNSMQAATAPSEPNKQQNTVMNLKLLAYERIILFIERMKPDSLIPRTLLPTMNSKEYQLLLLNEIRKEFEYNLSQQLYLSEESWVLTVNFKDNIITLINSAATECNATQPAGELAKVILAHYIASEFKADNIIRLIKQDIM